VPETTPNVILRMGSHSEKEYIEKTLKQFDGIMVGANLLQISPGATASLLLKLHNASGRPYYLDPMTYAFGAYFDPESGKVRVDLDWIKSNQKVPGGKKGETVRKFKGSYRKLADSFGPPFSSALDAGKAVSYSDFSTDQIVDDACKSVISFQAERLRKVFSDDPETARFANDLPGPAALFAPYFYVERSRSKQWIELNHRLALSSTKQRKDIPIHVVVCCHLDLLGDPDLSAQVVGNLLACKPAGVWLWFSRFDERLASKEELSALRWWVEKLSPSMSVFNMHGGFFSLALSKFGMTGAAHGVGYGEQKDVVPVIGQSTPTVQYYVRALHAKYSVALITRCFSKLGVKGPADFFSKICDCPICKRIVGDDFNAFAQFGEIHYSTPMSRRAAQTPAAAKRCRYHFLLNRIIERDHVEKSAVADIAKECVVAAGTWSKTLIGSGAEYLRLWAEVLSADH
jgi:hypothetical protein